MGTLVGIIGGMIGICAVALVALRPATFQSVDERFEKYMRSGRDLAVDYKLTYRGVAAGQGRYVQKNGRNLYFSYKGVLGDYVFAQNEEDATEIENRTQVYFVSDPFPGRFEPNSRISGAPEVAFPSIMLASGIRRFGNGPGKETVVGTETIGKEKADHVRYDVRGGQSPIQLDGWITADGRLLRFIIEAETPSGKIVTRFDFSNYRREAVEAKLFAPAVPAGYRLDGVRRIMDPVSVGEKLAVSERCLVALLGKGEPDRKLGVALDALKARIPILRVAPNDPMAKQMRASDTPLVCLVGADGVVQRIWVGFADEFPAELADAISKG